MSSNFGPIGPPAADLAARENLKTPIDLNGENGVSTFSRLFSYLRTIQDILMTLIAGPQASDRCPLGYLLHKMMTDPPSEPFKDLSEPCHEKPRFAYAKPKVSD